MDLINSRKVPQILEKKISELEVWSKKRHLIKNLWKYNWTQQQNGGSDNKCHSTNKHSSQKYSGKISHDIKLLLKREF